MVIDVLLPTVLKVPIPKKHHSNFGKHLSAETKDNMRKAHLGKHPSAETRKKLRENRLGDKNPFFGKHFSAQTLAEMSAKRKGRVCWCKGKRLSEATKANMHKAHLGNKNALGHKLTAKHRASISKHLYDKYREHPETRINLGIAISKYYAVNPRNKNYVKLLSCYCENCQVRHKLLSVNHVARLYDCSQSECPKNLVKMPLNKNPLAVLESGELEGLNFTYAATTKCSRSVDNLNFQSTIL